MEKPAAMEPQDAKDADSDTSNTEPDSMKREASTFEDFTQVAYEKALQQKKPIYLYFHANWCPTCKAQDPIVNTVFSEHSGGVAGFRVSYNDSATSDEERALAKTFNVTYQHTFFYIDREGKTVKKTIGSQTNEQITADLNTISR
jgi:thiol:disulfide interchange protein